MPQVIVPVGVAGIVPGARSSRPPGQRITAELVSLDTGMKLNFLLPPSESEREGSALWDEPGVCEADPEPLEYRWTKPETRTYRVVLDGYGRPGGMANTIEPELRILRQFTKRVPGLVRAHKCLYTQGEQSFRCVVESYHASIPRVGFTGGALQSDVQLNLKEI